jgi:hypothetical protein
VDPHPYADPAVCKRLLGFPGGGNCSRRRGERDEERVALRIDLDPVVAGERITNRTAMVAERVGVAVGTQLVQEPRRALDVGEQERDRSGRELAGHAAIQAVGHSALASIAETIDADRM